MNLLPRVDMKNFRAQSLLSLFLASSLSFSATAEDMLFHFLKEGNASSEVVETEVLSSFRKSVDESKLIHTGGQFEINSSFMISTDARGASVIAPQSEGLNHKFTNNDMDYRLGDVRFGAGNLAVWMEKTVSKVQELGFLKTKRMGIQVYSHCKDMVNAFFSPSDNLICTGHTYGTLGSSHLDGKGSVALDASVMIHELGHGLFHHLSTMNRGQFRSYGNDSLGAMNEGQADFLAHAVLGSEMFGKWMAKLMKDYWLVKDLDVYKAVRHKTEIRPIKNAFNLHRDHFDEIHDSGQIFAGALTEISSRIGKDTTLQLWLTAITRINETSNFYDHAQLVLEADQQLNRGANKSVIEEVFAARGIIDNDELDAESLGVGTLFIDKKEIVKTQLMYHLGLSEFAADYVLRNNNEDNTLQKGECGTVEVQLSNNSAAKTLAGLEILVPLHMVDKGLEVNGQNRAFVGTLEPGKKLPASIDISKKQRPWFFVCAGDDFTAEAKLPLFIKYAGEGTLRMDLALGK